jgi:hypothetical protein
VASWFKRYGIRLAQELNIVSGLLGVVAIALGVVAVVTGGLIRVTLIVIACLIAVPTFGYALVRAVPPRRKPPQEFEGKQLFVSDLASVNPRVPVLGVIGQVQTGKTTLHNLLLQKPFDKRLDPLTKIVTVHISVIIKQPATYWAIVDGRGEEYSQQFEVAEAAEILCILLDHNLVSEASSVNEDRINKHHEFGRQLRAKLESTWIKRKPSHTIPVHILLNKKDQWSKADDASRALLQGMLKTEQKEWADMTYIGSVTTADHSNSDSGDVVRATTALRDLWATRTPTP